MTHKLKKIQLQNEIVHSKKMENVNFPRIEQKIKKIKIFEDLPSDHAIIFEVERARAEAIICLDKHNVCFQTKDLLCPITITIEDGLADSLDSSEESSEDESDCAEDEIGQTREGCIDEYGDEIRLDTDELNADIQMLSSATGEVLLKNYSSDKTSLSETSPFTHVRCSSGKDIVVRKSSIVWLLSKSKTNLSSDRLVRVQESEFGIKKSKSKIDKTNI